MRALSATRKSRAWAVGGVGPRELCSSDESESLIDLVIHL